MIFVSGQYWGVWRNFAPCFQKPSDTRFGQLRKWPVKAWEAKNVIVMKRSMRSGYAGIENELFYHPRTKMLFGDAKDMLTKLVGELKGL